MSMREFITIVLCVVPVLVIGAVAHKVLLKHGYGVDVTSMRVMLDRCEVNLPRSQSCEVVISVRVKEISE